MSSKTADTEEETLESPTPPKTAPLSPDQREDDILEEEDESDQSEEDDDSESEHLQPEPHYHHRTAYTEEYSDDSSDLYSGDIECCFKMPGCLGMNNGSTQTLADDGTAFIIAVSIQLSLLAFVSFSVVWFLIGYMLPGCLCTDLFSHIYGLPTSAKLLSFICLIYFTVLGCMLYYSIRSIMAKEFKGLMALISMILMLLLASSISNLILIWKAGGWTTYLIYNADFYTNAGSVFMREDVRKAITTLAAFGQDSDIGANMRKIFYEEGLHQLEAMERTLKWSILGGWFIFNIFLIIVLCNIVKLRKKFAYGDFDRESMPQSIRHSQASLKSKRSSKSVRRDRPPSYSHVSPPKSVRSSYSTARSTNRTKMRNFDQSMTYANSYHHTQQMNPYHHHATLPRGEYVPVTLNRTMPAQHSRAEPNYYTVQNSKRRQNQKREDFLY